MRDRRGYDVYGRRSDSTEVLAQVSINEIGFQPKRTIMAEFVLGNHLVFFSAGHFRKIGQDEANYKRHFTFVYHLLKLFPCFAGTPDLRLQCMSVALTRTEGEPIREFGIERLSCAW